MNAHIWINVIDRNRDTCLRWDVLSKVRMLVCKPQEVVIRMDGLPFHYPHSLQGKYYRWMVLLH